MLADNGAMLLELTCNTIKLFDALEDNLCRQNFDITLPGNTVIVVSLAALTKNKFKKLP